jgi:hypothetical protein
MERDKQLIADPWFVASLPQTEMFKGSKPKKFTKTLEGTVIEFLEVDQAASSTFKGSYVSLTSTTHKSTIQAQKTFTSVNSGMSQYPLLAKAAEFVAGFIGLSLRFLSGI